MNLLPNLTKARILPIIRSKKPLVRGSKMAFLLPLILCCSGFSIVPASAGNLDVQSGASIKSSVSETKDGKSFIQGIVSKIGRLNDYIFDSEVKTYKSPGGKPKVEKGKFFYKRNHLIRILVTASGRKNGTVVVRRKDGQVRVKGGPALFGLTMTLSENSRLLNTASGRSVLKSDLFSVMGQLARENSSGFQSVVSSRPVTINSQNLLVFDLMDKSGNLLMDRVLVNPSTSMPVEWIRYKNGKLFADVKIKNLKLNPGLDDKLFEL